MIKQSFNFLELINNSGCFDLQFRKDTRHERTGSPTYYRWKAQFIVTVPKETAKQLKKVQEYIDCGNISISKQQAVFSVQKVDDVVTMVIPYFVKNTLTGKKKKEFSLWQKAVSIIHQNKGNYLTEWKKSDLLYLLQIHKSLAESKETKRKQKWLDMAQSLARTA